MENEITKLSSQSRAQMQIAEIKEVLRRAGQSSSGGERQKGDRRRRDRQAARASRRTGQGRQGKGEQLREFDSARRRQGPERHVPRRRRQETPISASCCRMPMGPGGNDKPGRRATARSCRAAATASATSTIPNLIGDATRIDSGSATTRACRAKRAPGRRAARPSSARPRRASRRRSYKRVYGDYTAVVEEVMSKEKVPPGYRFYIKRYFQLIKPRE